MDGWIRLARETWNLRDAALQKLAMDLQNGEHRQLWGCTFPVCLRVLTSNVYTRILNRDDFDKTALRHQRKNTTVTVLYVFACICQVYFSRLNWLWFCPSWSLPRRSQSKEMFSAYPKQHHICDLWTFCTFMCCRMYFLRSDIIHSFIESLPPLLGKCVVHSTPQTYIRLLPLFSLFKRKMDWNSAYASWSWLCCCTWQQV